MESGKTNLMVTISRATINDFKTIEEIGKISVQESHRGSCSEKDMCEFLEKTYNGNAIQDELSDENNIYHIINFNGIPAGFSKIILNAEHPNILQINATKLDRLYLLKEFFNLRLGFELLNFNIELSKRNNQSGMWLFTWIGNQRAVDFYRRTGFAVVGSHQFKVTETHYNEHHQMFLNFRDPDLYQISK